MWATKYALIPALTMGTYSALKLTNTKTAKADDVDIVNDENMFPEFAIDLSRKEEFVRNKYDFKLRT